MVTLVLNVTSEKTNFCSHFNAIILIWPIALYLGEMLKLKRLSEGNDWLSVPICDRGNGSLLSVAAVVVCWRNYNLFTNLPIKWVTCDSV